MALTFKGINSGGFGGYELTDQLLYNLKWFLDWNLLLRGAYGIYERGDISWGDETEAELHVVDDARYPSGSIWEGAGREWVWESGATLAGSGTVNPFRPSGVWIDGDFYPTATSTGTYAHHIDYLNGRVVFDEPRGDYELVQAEYTRRSVHVGFADEPDFRLLMLNAVDAFITDSSASSEPSREHQLWLPSIFIEVKDGTQRGQQLGGGQIKTRFVTFHIFADNPQDRNLLMDWLDYQSRTTFWLADLNQITFPFDQYGDIVAGVTNWVDMQAAYPWKKMRVVDSTPSTINSLNSQLFRARVVFEVEIDFGGI